MGKCSPIVPPHERTIEDGAQTLVGGWRGKAFIVAEVTCGIERKAGVVLDHLINYLGGLELSPVVDSILNLIPMV